MRRVVGSSCIAALLSIGAVVFAQTTGQNPTGASGQAGSPTMTSPSQPGDRVQTQQQITLVGCIQREADYRQAAGGGRGGTLGTGMGVGNEFVLVNASTASGSSRTAMSGTSTPTTGTAATGTAATGTAGTTTPPTTSTTAGATTSTPTTGTATAGTTAGATTAAGTTTGTATAGVSATTPDPSSRAGASMGTTMTSGGSAYALSGNREKELEQFVGQRVEIVGTLEGAGARSGAAGTTPSAGATSGVSGTATATTPGTATGTTTGTATGTAAAGTGTTTGAAGTTQRFGDLQQVNVVSFRAVGGSCTP